MHRGITVLGGIAVAASLLLAPSAGAATLRGDYQLQGTRTSSGAGPALTDVAGTNAFLSDSVMGTTRQVLHFPLHSGVSMSPSVGSGNVPYSVVATFRLDDVGLMPTADRYRRILDPSNGTEDTGFYALVGMATYFPEVIDQVTSSSAVFTPNLYATVAITSSPPAQSKIYVNGALVVTAAETLPVVSDTLRLFKDDSTAEESGGAVSCIRVYSGALTDPEVAGIGASPTCQAPATSQPQAPAEAGPGKKCKKHKKKHKRSAQSAKKKCKKHKKKR